MASLTLHSSLLEAESKAQNAHRAQAGLNKLSAIRLIARGNDIVSFEEFLSPCQIHLME